MGFYFKIISRVFLGLTLLFFLYEAISLFEVRHKVREIQDNYTNKNPFLEISYDNNFKTTHTILTLIEKYYLDAELFTFEDHILFTLEDMKDDGLLYSLKNSSSSIYVEAKEESISIPKTWFDSVIGKVYTVLHISKILNPKALATQVHSKSLTETLRYLVQTLDPYSKLLSKVEYDDLKAGTDGEFGGLGILVGMRNHLLTILELLPQSPAMKAGLHPADQILSINGKYTFGLSLNDLVSEMRGLPGSKTSISYLRDSTNMPIEVTINRELIQIDPVEIHLLKTPENNDVLSIKLDTFSSKSFKRIYEELTSSERDTLDGIIFDLRSNPGGLLDQAVNISDLLLNKGSIVTVKGQETDTEYANENSLFKNVPIIVLINEDSASASEIFAGALQDHDRAIVVGQPSFGKGTVQTVFELSQGRALKLTIARYLTPDGSSIQDIGVTPDIQLQSIYEKAQNQNMLGNYRYKSNSPFISKKKDQTTGKNSSDFLEAPDASSYYLEKVKNSEDPSKEIQLSLSLFDLYKAIPETSQKNVKASFILDSLKDEISLILDLWDKESIDFLKTKQIDWVSKQDPDENNLEVPVFDDLHIKDSESFYPGMKIPISFKIRNYSDEEQSRLSVFIRAMNRHFPTKEKLIGSLKPYDSKKESLEFLIPRHWTEGEVDLELGIAKNGKEIESSLQKIEIKIKERKNIDLEILSSQSEILHNGKSIILTIQIVNKSNESFQIQKHELANLSGKQIKVKTLKPLSSKEIKEQESVSFSYKIEAANLYSEKLKLGLLVDSMHFKKPHYKVINIDSAQSLKTRKKLGKKTIEGRNLIGE